jgi:hypothetical protein
MSTLNANESLLQAEHASTSDLTPAPLSGPANAVTFQTKQVAPPSRVYMQRDDQFFFKCISSSAGEIVTVRYRILMPDGHIAINEQDIALPNAYSPNVIPPFFQGAEGFLLSMGFFCNISNKRGQCFVRAGIARAATTLAGTSELLFADYISSQQPGGWPEGRVLDSTEGPGNLKVISVGNPAAGADISLQAPSNVRWKLRGFDATLTTAVAVANRNARLLLVDNALGEIRRVPSPADQAASLVVVYSLSGTSVAGSTAAAANTWALDDGMQVAGILGGFVRTSTANIQAADQWSGITVTVEEWMLGM